MVKVVDSCAARPGGHVVFEGVALSRGGRPVFDGLSLTLEERRIGLIGNNGSGKSTLLRLIAGLVQPDAGQVRVGGADVARERPNTGFLFQNPDHQILFPTVGEEVAFGLTARGIDQKTADARSEALLASNGCAGWEKRAVHELSEGQKQLVCLIAVLSPDPDLLLLDEPFSSLDLPTRYDLSHRLDALDQTIIMASHDLELLADFDRVLWLEAGRVRGDGPADSVIGAYRAHVRAGLDKARSA